MHRLRAAHLVLLLTAACSAGAVSAQGTAPSPTQAALAPQVQVELQLERKLLTLDLVGYREARTREQTARAQVDEATQKLDLALGGDSLALGTLESLYDALSGARATAQIAAQRVDWQVQRLGDRMRRISFLEGEVGGSRQARSDSITGRWRVMILPQKAEGIFDLRVDGTVVSGTYEVGAAKGSLRGFFVDRNLRLERIDAKGGFDSVFLGTFDPAAQTLNGQWTANELAGGQPTRGDWNAVRAPEERQP